MLTPEIIAERGKAVAALRAALKQAEDAGVLREFERGFPGQIPDIDIDKTVAANLLDDIDRYEVYLDHEQGRVDIIHALTHLWNLPWRTNHTDRADAEYLGHRFTVSLNNEGWCGGITPLGRDRGEFESPLMYVTVYEALPTMDALIAKMKAAFVEKYSGVLS